MHITSVSKYNNLGRDQTHPSTTNVDVGYVHVRTSRLIIGCYILGQREYIHVHMRNQVNILLHQDLYQCGMILVNCCLHFGFTISTASSPSFIVCTACANAGQKKPSVRLNSTPSDLDTEVPSIRHASYFTVNEKKIYMYWKTKSTESQEKTSKEKVYFSYPLTLVWFMFRLSTVKLDSIHLPTPRTKQTLSINLFNSGLTPCGIRSDYVRPV